MTIKQHTIVVIQLTVIVMIIIVVVVIIIIIIIHLVGILVQRDAAQRREAQASCG